MVNETLLTSGADVPFIEAGLVVHQPTLTEIGLIGGETEFRWGCEVLNISKESLKDMDKNVLDNIDNFDIFMKLMNNYDKDMHSLRESSIKVLSILFPSYEMTIGKDALIFTKDSEEHYIRKDTFPIFQKILVDICCLKGSDNDTKDFNPASLVAKQIADKMRKGRAQAALSKKDNKISILSRYASILAIGLQIDLNIPMRYTVFQLYDQYKRYQLWSVADTNLKARLAGAQDLDDPEDWRQDLHPDIK
jgi:hypothetical protein